jgi:hypothetical protein
MGLLRKAATTATRGDTGIAAPPAPALEPGPVATGLLKKSITLRTAEQPAPTVDAPSPLTVELVGAPAPAFEESLIEELESAEILDTASPSPEPPLAEPITDAALFEPPTIVRAADLEQHAPPPDAQPPAPGKPSAHEIVEGLITALRSLHGGVELPARLFTALASRLSIQKGAFLLYDPLRLVYAPWASTGYDQTTLHRMRIPLGANESWNALANGAPIVLADAQSLSSYQQYFSSREFGTISRIVLTPFIAEEKLIAVILLTDASSPFEDDAALLQCLSRLSATGSPLVHAARAARLAQGGDRVPPQDAAPEDEASRFIASFDPSIPSVLLLGLSTDEYARKIIASHEHLDPFRLHEDIRYFIGSFLTDIGRVMSVRQGLFIVGLTQVAAIDVDLFLHQLTLFLHGLFGGNGRSGASTGPHMTQALSWPSGGGDMRALIDSLSG